MTYTGLTDSCISSPLQLNLTVHSVHVPLLTYHFGKCLTRDLHKMSWCCMITKSCQTHKLLNTIIINPLSPLKLSSLDARFYNKIKEIPCGNPLKQKSILKRKHLI